MAERIPAGEFQLIKDAGHWPQWEQPEQFDRIVLEFLGRGVIAAAAERLEIAALSDG